TISLWAPPDGAPAGAGQRTPDRRCLCGDLDRPHAGLRRDVDHQLRAGRVPDARHVHRVLLLAVPRPRPDVRGPGRLRGRVRVRHARAARAHRARHEGAGRRPDLPDGRPADRPGERRAARLRLGLPFGPGAVPDLGDPAGRADHRRAVPARVRGVAGGGHPAVGLPAVHLARPGHARHLAGRQRGAEPGHGRAADPPDRVRPGRGHDRAGRRGDPSLLHGLADDRRPVRGADVHCGRARRPRQRARRRDRRPGGRGDPDDVHPGAAHPAPEPRALHRLHPGARPAPRRTTEAEMSQAPVDRSASDAVAARRRRIGWGVLLVAAVILPWLLPEQGYTLRVACLILLFAALAQAWNIAAGLSGLISLGHAGFFGAGAYVSTLLLINFGISPWFGMVAALLFGALLAALLSLPTLRLRGHYFAL